VTCTCFKTAGNKYIDHDYGCSKFRNFYNSLVNQGVANKTDEEQEFREKIVEENEQLVEAKQDDPNFLKAPKDKF
jgi:hypothetical protein